MKVAVQNAENNRSQLIRKCLEETVNTTSASGKIIKKIHEKIRHCLFTGELQPKSFYSTEGQIAEDFDISRLPVRDALRTLQAIGLIDIKVGKSGGIFIAQPNPDKYADALAVQLELLGISEDELFEAQELIEGLIVQQAAKKTSKQDIRNLNAILDDMESLLREDIGELANRSMDFHLAIASITENRILVLQIQVILTIMSEHVWDECSEAKGEHVIQNHRILVKHLEAQDIDSALNHIKKHIQEIRDYYLHVK